MPRKQTESISSLLKVTQNLFNNKKTDKYIPNIIEFCNSPAYLGFSTLSPPIKLRPVQEIILKCFYRGSVGNENIEITKEDKEIIERCDLNSLKNGNITEKWESKEIFKELVLVWGRRSGKDFVISIIALYEAMKLLEAPGGNPYKIYNLGSANPFTILTIANSSEQAKVLYREIKEKFIHSPYFKDKFLTEGITSDCIYLLTPQDKEDNEEFKKKGLPVKLGSILIRSGHSNSDSLLGTGCFVLLLDEVASFKTTGGSSSGERIYTALTPTTKTYVRKVPVLENGIQKLDKNGKPEFKAIYDGKVISISSPRGMDGVLWDLYNKANQVPHRLMCRVPTWVVDPAHDKSILRADESQMTDEQFMMEYGAEFSGTAGENFFNIDDVNRCFDNHYQHKEFGEPGYIYYAHLDPAISSHNYTLCVVHKEFYLNEETHKVEFIIVLDHLKYWHPTNGKPVLIEQVDEYLISLQRRFHLGLITYDQLNSVSSIQKLRKSGIPAQMTPFTRSYQMQVYDELHSLVAQNRILIPLSYSTKLLKDEMLNLQRRFIGHGYKIYPKNDGEVNTDDACDALAGACYNAIKTEVNSLPKSKLVDMGSMSSNNRTWRSMSGVLGVGNGQQVARELEKRSQAYPRR